MSFLLHLKELKEKYGNGIACEKISGEKKTYEDFYQDILYIMDKMKDVGDRIAILGSPSYELVVHLYGALSLGKSVALIDYMIQEQDIAALSSFSDVSVLYLPFQDDEITNAIQKLERSIEVLPYYVLGEASDLCSLEKEYPEGEILYFTSGTVSNAKCTVVSSEKLWKNIIAADKLFVGKEQSKIYIPLPVHHIFGGCMILLALVKGKTICYGNIRNVKQELEYFNPEEWITVCALAERYTDLDMLPSNLKIITVSGSVCDKTFEEKVKAKGIHLQNVYGATELGGIAVNKLGDDVNHLTAFQGYNIQINADGLIMMETDYAPKEYYKNPDATQALYRDGLLCLEDMGEWNEDNTFKVLGRNQNIIAMANGDKLYLEELENDLNNLFGVIESSVLYFDKKIVAVVVCESEEISEKVRSEVTAYRKKQPHYKKFDEIWVRTMSIPRSNIGKVLIGKVREQYETRG